jgi:GNAT superfamily N-acetyltransferase
VQIRRGVPDDAAALAAFAERTFVATFGADNDPRDLEAFVERTYGVAQQAAELSDPGVSTLLAHRDGRLLAFAQVRRHVPPPCVSDATAIELRRFYVDSPAHGTGVAQLLMAAVFDAARDAGARHVWLGVWERNPRAIAFYRKCGFTDVGSQPFVLGSDHQNDRVMVARVPDL